MHRVLKRPPQRPGGHSLRRDVIDFRRHRPLQISLPQPYETFVSSLPASPLSRIFLSSRS